MCVRERVCMCVHACVSCIYVEYMYMNKCVLLSTVFCMCDLQNVYFKTQNHYNN